MELTPDELRAHLLYHIMKQYGTKEEGNNAWVLPVIEEGPPGPEEIKIADVVGNVVMLRLQEEMDDGQGAS